MSVPTGKFILLATIEAKGKAEADQIEALLAKVAKRARSDEEPNCHGYQPARSLKDPNTFIVFEQYDNKGSNIAVDQHREGKDFQELMSHAAEWTNKVDMQFFEDVVSKI